MSSDFTTVAFEGSTRARFRLHAPWAHNEVLRQRFADFCRRPLNAPGPLKVHEFEHVVLEDSPTGICLYDAEGRRIGPSCVTRYSDDLVPGFWRARETIDARPIRGRVEEPVVFGGAMIRHWGHFLLESMSRAWASAAEPRLDGLPWVYSWAMADGELGPNYRAYLDALDLPWIGDGRPRKLAYARCFTPEISFATVGYADPAHLSAPHRVARRLLGGDARDPRPVYFSRTTLKPHADTRPTLRNEGELERALAARGVRVARMETLSLPEQIELMNAHSVFIGPWGSALHNTLFSLRGAEIATYVLIGRFLPTNFLLVDAIVGNAAHYLVTLARADDYEATRQVTIDVEATLSYLREQGVI